jgi:CheY-like chemotaxis protein
MRKKEINEIFRKYKSDNEIYHDLMPLRTREILLVASIYDAFTLEQDGLLSEVVFGGFYRLTLSNAPRITNVSTEEEAIERLKSRHYDMVIVMSRVNLAEAIEFSRRVKTIDDALPLMLLLNDNNEIGHIEQKRSELMEYYDNVFVWNGNSEIFLAMVKYIEDKVNVYNDTNIGLVRVILLVEDSIRYYSRYMPLLYTEIMKQTQRLVHEKNIDEMTRMLRMRARPKVILASSFEEALDQFETYKDYLLCVISDVKYPKDGVLDDFAGVKLVKELKSRNPDLPILLQSSDAEGRVIARDLDVTFIHKNSETLATELANFFLQ